MDHGGVIRRHELSDAEWEFVSPLLPRWERGRKRWDDRTVHNGIVWKFRTGTAWRDVPERYGSWATLDTRFRRWAKDVRADAPGCAGEGRCGRGHRLTQKTKACPVNDLGRACWPARFFVIRPA
ncbi:transposase [Streptomyces sp. NPDC019539]|uniref:transposase n=1 Tax=Streptomyces sp. NPDC019539 TaxID=3365063 RepID=UPI0037B6F248